MRIAGSCQPLFLLGRRIECQRKRGRRLWWVLRRVSSRVLRDLLLLLPVSLLTRLGRSASESTTTSLLSAPVSPSLLSSTASPGVQHSPPEMLRELLNLVSGARAGSPQADTREAVAATAAAAPGARLKREEAHILRIPCGTGPVLAPCSSRAGRPAHEPQHVGRGFRWKVSLAWSLGASASGRGSLVSPVLRGAAPFLSALRPVQRRRGPRCWRVRGRRGGSVGASDVRCWPAHFCP